MLSFIRIGAWLSGDWRGCSTWNIFCRNLTDLDVPRGTSFLVMFLRLYVPRGTLRPAVEPAGRFGEGTGGREKDGRKGRGKAASSVVSDAVVQHLHAGRACGESKIVLALSFAASGVVPPAGIEPASLAASDFESDASTNSATGANGRG